MTMTDAACAKMDIVGGNRTVNVRCDEKRRTDAACAKMDAAARADFSGSMSSGGGSGGDKKPDPNKAAKIAKLKKDIKEWEAMIARAPVKGPAMRDPHVRTLIKDLSEMKRELQELEKN